jgi:hypothetical protein
MYYMSINKNSMHQVRDQTRLKLYVGFNMSCLPVLLFGKVCHFRNEYLDKIFAKRSKEKIA